MPLISRTGVTARRAQAVNVGSPAGRPWAASQQTADHFIVWPSGRCLGASASRTDSSPPTRSTAARTRAWARPGSGVRCPWPCWGCCGCCCSLWLLLLLRLLLGRGLGALGGGLALGVLGGRALEAPLLLGLVLAAELGELGVERVAVPLRRARPPAPLGALLRRALLLRTGGLGLRGLLAGLGLGGGLLARLARPPAPGVASAAAGCSGAGCSPACRPPASASSRPRRAARGRAGPRPQALPPASLLRRAPRSASRRRAVRGWPRPGRAARRRAGPRPQALPPAAPRAAPPRRAPRPERAARRRAPRPGGLLGGGRLGRSGLLGGGRGLGGRFRRLLCRLLLRRRRLRCRSRVVGRRPDRGLGLGRGSRGSGLLPVRGRRLRRGFCSVRPGRRGRGRLFGGVLGLLAHEGQRARMRANGG